MNMKKKLTVGAVICSMMGILLAGCSDDSGAKKREKVEGLETIGTIAVISREEGSGTRNVFAQLLGFSDGENTSQSDRTRNDAVILDNTEKVLEKIAEDDSAIGYVSAGSVSDNSEIKTLKVNGYDVTGDREKYPLSRIFYVAYQGTLSDVERDFLTFVKSAGQEIVMENYEYDTNYIWSLRRTGGIYIWHEYDE